MSTHPDDQNTPRAPVTAYMSTHPDDRYVTREVVTAFLARYLDQHPDGRPLVEYRSGAPWKGKVSDNGIHVYCPTAFDIMRETSSPEDLTSNEVLFLILTSDCSEMYTADDQAALEARWRDEAAARRAAMKAPTASRRNKARKSQAGRVDYTLGRLPRGLYEVPDDALPRRVKLAKTSSLKKAEKRRETKRKEAAITLTVKPSNWRNMSPSDWKDHCSVIDDLVRKGTINAVYDPDDDSDPRHKVPNYLHRFGRVARR